MVDKGGKGVNNGKITCARRELGVTNKYLDVSNNYEFIYSSIFNNKRF